MDGERDFVVLVDLGGGGDVPRYWIVPAGEANRLITSEQLRTKDVAEFENRRELLDVDR